jgi:hypothetical protein
MPHPQQRPPNPRRVWWLPIALAAAGGLVAVGLGLLEQSPRPASRVVVQVGEGDVSVSAPAEYALATSAATRERASESLADAGVRLSPSELLGRSTVEVDPLAGTVEISVSGAADTDTTVAEVLAEAYLTERQLAEAATRDERARFLAEQSATVTRDLLTATLTVATADDDMRDLGRLESRLVALEVERDRLELVGASTADVERQLADVQGRIDSRTPSVSTVDLARAQASVSLLTAQLETIRVELMNLSGPLPDAGHVLVPAAAAPADGSTGVELPLVALFAGVGLLVGLVVAIATRSLTRTPSPMVLDEVPAPTVYPEPSDAGRPMPTVVPAPAAGPVIVQAPARTTIGAPIVPSVAAPPIHDPRSPVTVDEPKPQPEPEPEPAPAPAPEPIRHEEAPETAREPEPGAPPEPPETAAEDATNPSTRPDDAPMTLEPSPTAVVPDVEPTPEPASVDNAPRADPMTQLPAPLPPPPSPPAQGSAPPVERGAVTEPVDPGWVEPTTIAIIPPAAETQVHPVTINHPASAAAVAYFDLTRRLMASVSHLPTPAVCFVGPGSGTGRTTLAVNVAAAAVSAGHKTLLVTPLWEEVDIPGLPVLPPGLGITEPSSFPGPREFREALTDVSSLIDVVFIDTDAADTHPEAIELAALSDLAAVVAMGGPTGDEAVADIVRRLGQLGGRIAGVVVNAHEAALAP